METPSSTSSDGDFKSNDLEEQVRKRPKVKVRRKCLRTQSTSELPQLTNGGLTKGIRRVHSSSSFYRMTALEESDRYAQVRFNNAIVKMMLKYLKDFCNNCLHSNQIAQFLNFLGKPTSQ